MQLILWRHAEAVDDIPDSARRLTGKGEKQAEKMAVFLSSHLPPAVRILVSPAKRAQQTALALTKDFIIEPNIAPGASPEALLQVANWPESEESVLIVGHQPALGGVAARLLSNLPTSYSIKKGAVWWINCRSREHATLLLAIAPNFL